MGIMDKNYECRSMICRFFHGCTVLLVYKGFFRNTFFFCFLFLLFHLSLLSLISFYLFIFPFFLSSSYRYIKKANLKKEKCHYNYIKRYI
ncbi:hypothetical protein RhiirC2_156124 [Rhizophagus irregularis]|uniref:Uncharacterized protein n=1 Tax=Rhizophagus irregularis TaxID=588596 RepID=A0A2N1NRR5_9GLOM|nr:hypothetical protein RhiirC2_156124 [Rhizophagus irregularis]